MQEIRCTKCNKMLATANGLIIKERPTVLICKAEDKETFRGIIDTQLEIKCPRCKTLNEVVV